MRLFHSTGDFIFRNDWENFTRTTRDLFVKVGVPHEVVPVDVVRKEYPQFDLTGIGVALYEKDAGVVRARRACQCVAARPLVATSCGTRPRSGVPLARNCCTAGA